LKRGAKLDRLSADRRHKIRIQAKKLRYASDLLNLGPVDELANPQRMAEGE